MSITVDDIQGRIASVLDQDGNSSNIDTSDYALRLTYMNMALREWSEIYDWQALYTEFNTLTSTSTGNTSIALPSNFRKLASYPVITADGATSSLFPEVRPQEAGQYSTNDKRVEITGNPLNGYNMAVFGTALVSGASIKVPYYQSPTSLVSPANTTEIPNPEYLVRRTIAHWWEARGDDRFPQAKAEAERILANMIDYENVFSEASTNDRVKTVEETRYGDLRWGE